MNKRDAMNQIRQFGSKFDRRAMPPAAVARRAQCAKTAESGASNPASRKSNVFNEQVRYAWHRALQIQKPAAGDLPDGHGHRHFVDPAVCYMVYKNVSSAASQYYPAADHRLSGKTLDDDAAARWCQLQAEQGVDKVNYLSRAMRRWGIP